LHVRAAVPEDNAKLIAIEQLTPQGDQIKLVSERKDYFIRAKKFEEPILLVAEDENQQDILGIMGVGPVTVRLGGEAVRGGLIFDWRSNPLAQTGLPRHMLRLWQAVKKEIERQDLKFIFGYVKEDNERSIGVLQKFGAKAVETREFLTMPVHGRFCRDRTGVGKVNVIKAVDPVQEYRELEQSFGSQDLFLESPRSGHLKERYMFSKFSFGGSSVKVWDTNADYTQRVLNMPTLYKAARPVLRVGSKLMSVPHIPNIGDAIRIWQLYDLIIDRPEDLMYILERVRLAARENDVHYLVACLNSRDRGYDQIAKKAWVRLKYHLFFVPMGEVPLPQEPTYFDVTYL